MESVPIQTRIYPWVKRASVSEDDMQSSDIQRDGVPMIYPFLGNLAVLFAADLGNRFQILTYEQLPEGMTDKDLFSIAIENLLNNIRFGIIKTGFGGYALIGGGNHEANALCANALWENISDEIGDDLIVAVPARDTVLIAEKSQSAVIEALKERAAEIFAEGNQTLSEVLFQYDRRKKEFATVSGN